MNIPETEEETISLINDLRIKTSTLPLLIDSSVPIHTLPLRTKDEYASEIAWRESLLESASEDLLKRRHDIMTSEQIILSTSNVTGVIGTSNWIVYADRLVVDISGLTNLSVCCDWPDDWEDDLSCVLLDCISGSFLIWD